MIPQPSVGHPAIKEAVKQQAQALGFDDCRVTSANPPESAARFQRWLAEGLHGQMHYLQRNALKRLDPQLVLPEAQTIVTLAVSYSQPPSAPSRPSTPSPLPSPLPRGLVARYARYADYHDVLGARLESLTDFINQLGGPGTRSVWYVDTGPVLERDLAQRAGLGFVGKHTNLISRRLGNWILLAEILTTLELEPDPPEPNRCGSCTRCIAACPTSAITGPFQLDARRCVSYLTIELKGPIPPELRPAIGDRIFGCDDCLAVCPWNRFAQEGRLMQAHRRPAFAAPDLVEVLALDETALSRRFAGTPLQRPGRRGLRRNVCVALGNLGDKTALPALEQAARDPDPLIREHADWAIGEVKRRLPLPDPAPPPGNYSPSPS